MTERQIIFSAPMVRAILSGSKSQTRRVVNPSHRAQIDLSRGDRLWVRETWQAIDGNELALRIMTEPHPSRGWIEYAATVPEGHEPPPRWRPSIHMPRWASRITLEVTGVRVERLQDISEADALAEGIARHADGNGFHIEDGMHYSDDPRESFASLWDSINGHGSWDANPWVFVIEFKRIKP